METCCLCVFRRSVPAVSPALRASAPGCLQTVWSAFALPLPYELSVPGRPPCPGLRLLPCGCSSGARRPSGWLVYTSMGLLLTTRRSGLVGHINVTVFPPSTEESRRFFLDRYAATLCHLIQFSFILKDFVGIKSYKNNAAKASGHVEHKYNVNIDCIDYKLYICSVSCACICV